MRYSFIAFFLGFVFHGNAQLNSTPPPGADSIVPVAATGVFHISEKEYIHLSDNHPLSTKHPEYIYIKDTLTSNNAAVIQYQLREGDTVMWGVAMKKKTGVDILPLYPYAAARIVNAAEIDVPGAGSDKKILVRWSNETMAQSQWGSSSSHIDGIDIWDLHTMQLTLRWQLVNRNNGWSMCSGNYGESRYNYHVRFANNYLIVTDNQYRDGRNKINRPAGQYIRQEKHEEVGTTNKDVYAYLYRNGRFEKVPLAQ